MYGCVLLVGSCLKAELQSRNAPTCTAVDVDSQEDMPIRMSLSLSSALAMQHGRKYLEQMKDSSMKLNGACTGNIPQTKTAIDLVGANDVRSLRQGLACRRRSSMWGLARNQSLVKLTMTADSSVALCLQGLRQNATLQLAETEVHQFNFRKLYIYSYVN